MDTISSYQSRNRALATGCAFIVGFTGAIHEVVGPLIFPWAPAFFGDFLWHAIGLVLMVLGTTMAIGVLN